MSYIRYSLIVILSLLCSSCGFHLNGLGTEARHIPISKLFIQCDNVIICPELISTIQKKQLTTITSDASNANVIIKLFDEVTNRQPLNYNNLGRISAYTLYYQISAQVWQDNQQVGNDISISAQQNMQYTDSLILASNQEEAKLWEILHQKSITQLINHLIYFKYLHNDN